MPLSNNEEAVYPGHPVTIALLIVMAYPSLRAATSISDRSSYRAALASADIPGAGGNVVAALDLLESVIDGHRTLAEAVDDAAIWWARCDGQAAGGGHPLGTSGFEWYTTRHRRGQEQADRIVGELEDRLRTWGGR